MNRTKENSLQTLKHLEYTALEIYQAHGFKGLTFKNLSLYSGVHKSTIQYRFKKAADIQLYVALTKIDYLLGDTGSHESDDLLHFILCVLSGHSSLDGHQQKVLIGAALQHLNPQELYLKLSNTLVSTITKLSTPKSSSLEP